MCGVFRSFTQAVKLQEWKERERRQEEENNRTDILNHLQGELLSENTQRSARVHRDCYKGMTPEQIREFTICQQQQAEEKVNSTHTPDRRLLSLKDELVFMSELL